MTLVVFCSHPCQIAQDKMHSHLDLPSRLTCYVLLRKKQNSKVCHSLTGVQDVSYRPPTSLRNLGKGKILVDDNIPGQGEREDYIRAKTFYISFCPGKFIWWHFQLHEMIHPCLGIIRPYVSTFGDTWITKYPGISKFIEQICS